MIRLTCMIILTSVTSKRITIVGKESEPLPTCFRMTPTHTPVTEDPQACSKQSCKGRCGEKPSLADARPCSCHETCIVLNNCCKDFTSFCQHEITREDLKHLSLNPLRHICEDGNCYSCINDAYLLFPIYAVSRCPSDTRTDSVELCENPTERLIEHIPIMHTGSKDVFRNVYCAHCHDRDLTQFRLLQPVFICPQKANRATFYSTPLEDIYLSDLASSKCITKGDYLGEWLSVDCCVIHENPCESINNCSNIRDCSNARKCDRFQESVHIMYEGRQLIVRNRHCAECISRTLPSSNISCFENTLVNKLIRPLRQGKSAVPPFNLTHFIRNQESLTSKPHFTSDTGEFRPSMKFFINAGTIKDLYAMYLGNKLMSKFFSVEHSLSRNGDGGCSQIVLTVTASKRDSIGKRLIDWIRQFVNIYDELLYEKLNICRSVISNTFTDIQTSCLSYTTVVTLAEMCQEKIEQSNEGFAICQFSKLPPFQTVLSPPENLSSINISNFPDDWLWSSESIVCGNFTLAPLSVTDNDDQKSDILVGLNCSIHTTEFQFVVNLCSSSISVLALVVSICVECASRSYKSLSFWSTLGFLFSFLFAEIIHLLTIVATLQNAMTCVTLSVLAHFFWLSVFSWCNAMVLSLCRFATGYEPASVVSSSSTRCLTYSLAVLVIPVFITGVCVYLDFLHIYTIGYGNGVTRWIGNNYAFLLALMLPLTISILINIIAFLIIEMEIRSSEMLAKETRVLREVRHCLPLYIVVTGIIGLTWIFGFFATLLFRPVLWFAFSITISFQGLLVCCALTCPSIVSMFQRSNESGRGRKCPHNAGTVTDRSAEFPSSPDTHHTAQNNSEMATMFER